MTGQREYIGVCFLIYELFSVRFCQFISIYFIPSNSLGSIRRAWGSLGGVIGSRLMLTHRRVRYDLLSPLLHSECRKHYDSRHFLMAWVEGTGGQAFAWSKDLRGSGHRIQAHKCAHVGLLFGIWGQVMEAFETHLEEAKVFVDSVIVIACNPRLVISDLWCSTGLRDWPDGAQEQEMTTINCIEPAGCSAGFSTYEAMVGKEIEWLKNHDFDSHHLPVSINSIN